LILSGKTKYQYMTDVWEVVESVERTLVLTGVALEATRNPMHLPSTLTSTIKIPPTAMTLAASSNKSWKPLFSQARG
jgi:hypothetical protein